MDFGTVWTALFVLGLIAALVWGFWPKKEKFLPEQYSVEESDQPQSEEAKAEELRQLKENEATALQYLQNQEDAALELERIANLHPPVAAVILPKVVHKAKRRAAEIKSKKHKR